jgi:sugar lactone lactonase YvrE
VPDIVGSMALRERGGAIVALGSGVHTLDFATGAVAPFALLDPRRGGAAGRRQGRPGGRFVFGTSHRTMKEPRGGLYSLGADAALVQLDGECFSATARAGRPTTARSTTPTACAT